MPNAQRSTPNAANVSPIVEHEHGQGHEHYDEAATGKMPVGPTGGTPVPRGLHAEAFA